MCKFYLEVDILAELMGGCLMIEGDSLLDEDRTWSNRAERDEDKRQGTWDHVISKQGLVLLLWRSKVSEFIGSGLFFMWI